MKNLKLLALLLLGAPQAFAAGALNCRTGGTGPGAGNLSNTESPSIFVNPSEVYIGLGDSFDTLATTGELAQSKVRAICNGYWEETVHLPFYGRLIGVEYQVESVNFDFQDNFNPGDVNESMKLLGGSVYIRGVAKVNGREDGFEKDLKLPSNDDINEANGQGRPLFPLYVSGSRRTIRENNSVCGTDISIRLDEISANVFRTEQYASASARIVIPSIVLKFIPVNPGDNECVNR